MPAKKIGVLSRLETHRVIDPFTGCWIWTKALDKDGYGLIKINKVMCRVNRVSYETFKGPIPEGLHVLHSCDHPPCFNPDHLEAGTEKKNRKDAFDRGRISSEIMKPWFSKRSEAKRKKTHCRRGHEFSSENTGFHSDGARQCKMCANLMYQKRKQRRKNNADR